MGSELSWRFSICSCMQLKVESASSKSNIFITSWQGNISHLIYISLLSWCSSIPHGRGRGRGRVSSRSRAHQLQTAIHTTDLLVLWNIAKLMLPTCQAETEQPPHLSSCLSTLGGASPLLESLTDVNAALRPCPITALVLFFWPSPFWLFLGHLSFLTTPLCCGVQHVSVCQIYHPSRSLCFSPVLCTSTNAPC